MALAADRSYLRMMMETMYLDSRKIKGIHSHGKWMFSIEARLVHAEPVQAALDEDGLIDAMDAMDLNSLQIHLTILTTKMKLESH